MLLQGRLLSDASEPPRPGWVEIDGAAIVAVERGEPPRPADAGGPGMVICPGFVDAHLHVPQIESIGHDGLDLLAWLEQVIYPAEARWADPAHAERQIGLAWRRLLRSGTLGCAAYLSAHPHGLERALACAGEIPIRARLGQVLMDREAPAALLGQPAAPPCRSGDRRLESTVNPRFAIACTDRLLAAAGRRATGGEFVQTHLAETPAECRRVAELFPDDPSYAAVYDRHGLLGPRTLLAHGIHLAPGEWALVAARGSVVVHCPTANLFLGSGLFPLSLARAHGVRLALGSDVAAGPDLAMPRVARAMIDTARARALTVEPEAPIPTPAEAWTLITRGNADALGWPDAGRLEPGAAADLLGLEVPFPPDEHLVSKLLYTWDDDYIKLRILNGRDLKAES